MRDPELVDFAVVEALGLTDHTARLPREALLGHLAERQLLLVLDGFEHLVEVCAELVAELLGRVPGLRVLAVGRRPLELAGERIVAVAPLGEDEALELFADRAAQQGVILGDEPGVRELCRRLDGIPRRRAGGGAAAGADARELLARFDDRFRLLVRGAGTRCPGTRRSARRSAGATSCARPRNGCSGHASRCSPDASTWRPPSTCAEATA